MHKANRCRLVSLLQAWQSEMDGGSEMRLEGSTFCCSTCEGAPIPGRRSAQRLKGRSLSTSSATYSEHRSVEIRYRLHIHNMDALFFSHSSLLPLYKNVLKLSNPSNWEWLGKTNKNQAASGDFLLNILGSKSYKQICYSIINHNLL